MIEMRPYLTAVTDAVTARNTPAAQAAAVEALTLILERRYDGLMIDATLPPSTEADPALVDAWRRYWDSLVDFLDSVRKLTAPIVVVPAIPA